MTGQDGKKSALVIFEQAARSFLLLFLLLFPLNFLYLVFHEGGHALQTLFLGGPVDMFYVHPFSLNGYVRPFAFMDNPWHHAAGPLLGVLASLLIFLFTWKKRSTSLLPLVMLFPWAAIMQGFRLVMGGGDAANISRLTGLSPALFQGLGAVLLLVGIFFFLSLLPLLGFSPRDAKVLLLLPAAVLFWALIGLVVGVIVVPASPIALRYDLAEELLVSVRTGPVTSIVLGTFLAGLFLTLYRWLYPHLPANLRCEKMDLVSKDLRVPAILAAVCTIIGLIVIA
jgi:hypothetical protein